MKKKNREKYTHTASEAEEQKLKKKLKHTGLRVKKVEKSFRKDKRNIFVFYSDIYLGTGTWVFILHKSGCCVYKFGGRIVVI